MHEDILIAASRLSDQALLARMKALSGQSREVTVELIAHLLEVARRGIHRAEGPGKLFGYLTGVLRFSEAAAWNRIQAARAVRRFPMILDLLADGLVNLTTIRLLVPHLTKENHRSLLAEAIGKSKNDIKKMVARLNPRPDVPATVRKLPTPVKPTATQQSSVAPTVKPSAVDEPLCGTDHIAPLSRPESHRPVVEPLAPERYRLQLTMDQETHDDLRWLQDTFRREIPDGDPAAIVARALRLLREHAQKKAYAATSKPRPPRGTKPGSRDIPAGVQRAVWRRDGGQCGFVAANGRRCEERSYLEYHHAVVAYSEGGEATVENIALRCRAHNVYEAELLFGPYEPRVRESPPVHAAGTCSGTNGSGRVSEMS
jgi:hypothetical protein